MNEIDVTFFQIKPVIERWGDRNCQFMNDVFDLDDIHFISGVKTYENISMFFFDVELSTYDSPNKSITYRFHQKSSALKAQRELARAFTKTGEFEYVEQKEDTEAEDQLPKG